MEMQDMLADRLKQKRALSHASLEEYSKELGISKSALQKYEAGTGNPTLATVQTIADHLHESPAQLLGMADRIGSLEVGKDADIAIFEGNPLRDIQCKTKAVFVNGQQVSKG